MYFLFCFAYRHVWLAAGIHRLRHRIHEVPTDAKITHFHLTLHVYQDVRGFHICKKINRKQENQLLASLKSKYPMLYFSPISPLCITDRLLWRCSNAFTICNGNIKHQAHYRTARAQELHSVKMISNVQVGMSKKNKKHFIITLNVKEQCIII